MPGVPGGWPGRGAFSSAICGSIRRLLRVGGRLHADAGVAQPYLGGVENSST